MAQDGVLSVSLDPDAFPEDEYIRVEDRGADLTVFVFSGVDALFTGLARFEFLKIFERIQGDYNLVFFRDVRRLAYHVTPTGEPGGLDFYADKVDELRERLGELDPSLPTIVACRSGLRSYVGTRILKQHGFGEVYNLSGATAMREFALNRRLPASRTTTPTGVPSPDAIMID